MHDGPAMHDRVAMATSIRAWRTLELKRRALFLLASAWAVASTWPATPDIASAVPLSAPRTHDAASAVTSGARGMVDPTLYQALSWRLVGPFRGGRVLAVVGIPGDGRQFYFGAVDGGVWKTEDAGRTWMPIFDREPAGSIGALAIAPSDPRTLYVGTGEADMRSDIAHGDGVYKTTDGGRNWVHVGLDDTRQIGRILVDPRNPDVVYVAALGHAYGPNAASSDRTTVAATGAKCSTQMPTRARSTSHSAPASPKRSTLRSGKRGG